MMRMGFKVRVQLPDRSFRSDVYAINGNEFLLYNDVDGFGWYSIINRTMDGNAPAITLVREEDDGED